MAETEQRLVFFGAYVADEKAASNVQPNIGLLLDTIEHNLQWNLSAGKEVIKPSFYFIKHAG